MTRVADYLAAAGALATVALLGCNAVLGIDQAHSRDDGTTTSTVQAIPISGCDVPNTECSTCVASSKAFGTCLGDHKCRKALDTYRACLGSKCNGAGCFDALAASAGADVAEVVSTECPQCEGNTPLVTMCDLYCRCMEQILPPATQGAAPDGLTCETFNDALPWTAGNMAACKDACGKLAATDVASVNCRWGHCELAANGESRSHCGHAIDDSVCPKSAAPNPDCKDRNLPGWACDIDSDCCSNRCSGNICAK